MSIPMLPPAEGKGVKEIAGDALSYLALTDADAAKAAALVVGLEKKVKIVFAAQFVEARAKTVKEREAMAMISQAYQEIVEALENAVLEHETYKAMRATAESRFRWAQSLNANRRQVGTHV